MCVVSHSFCLRLGFVVCCLLFNVCSSLCVVYCVLCVSLFVVWCVLFIAVCCLLCLWRRPWAIRPLGVIAGWCVDACCVVVCCCFVACCVLFVVYVFFSRVVCVR